MYGWQNDAGEPIMDGAAYRFEQQLDYDNAMERWGDGSEFYDYDEDEDEEPEVDDDFPMSMEYPMEDQWLDGSYEE